MLLPFYDTVHTTWFIIYSWVVGINSFASHADCFQLIMWILDNSIFHTVSNWSCGLWIIQYFILLYIIYAGNNVNLTHCYRIKCTTVNEAFSWFKLGLRMSCFISKKQLRLITCLFKLSFSAFEFVGSYDLFDIRFLPIGLNNWQYAVVNRNIINC